jgi:Uma2 family endonuclease
MQTVPRVPLDRQATYADLVAVPEHLVAEILDDELYTSPRPAPRHAVAQVRVASLLDAAFGRGRGGPGGWLILMEPELHASRDVLVPDLAGWRRERLPRVPEEAFFRLAPDWVCEVLSPGTAATDRTKKLRIYAREGVQHAWLVDPLARLLEVLRLDAGGWVIAATYAGADVVRAAPFDAVDLELAALWDVQ